MIKKDHSVIGSIVRFMSQKEVITGTIVDYNSYNNSFVFRVNKNNYSEDWHGTSFKVIEVLERKTPNKDMLNHYISLLNQEKTLHEKANNIFNNDGMDHSGGIDTDYYEEIMESIGYFGLTDEIDQYREKLIKSCC